MARRSKSVSPIDIVDIVAALPWWVGVLLAIGFYVLLDPLTGRPMPADARASEMTTHAVVNALATVGQYLLPALCLAGAAMSAITRARRRKLLDRATGNDAARALAAMGWREFEALLAEGFRRRGFEVRETGGGGSDGGVDLVLRKAGETFLVQAKHWRAFNVGVGVVRELYGVMAASGAAGAFVVTSGKFTQPAIEFAAGRNIHLVDGSQLQGLLGEAQAPSARGAAAEDRPEPEAVAPRSMPACPSCGKAMVLRTAKRGANAGSEFWGCSDYPKCRGTRTVG